MLKEFFTSIKNDEIRVISPSAMSRECNTPSAMLPLCVDEMMKNIVNYSELKPIDGTYVVDNGFRLGRYKNPDVCSTPWGLEMDGEHFVSIDYSKSYIYYFDEDSVLVHGYKVNKNSDNRSCISATFNDTHIFVGTYYNRFLAIDKDTGDVAWEFGKYNSRGKCSDNKIGKVYNLGIAPNGNVLVLTYDGAGDANRYYGTLEEFDTDGNWIKTLLENKGSGLGSNLETYNPKAIQVIDDVIYVGKNNEIDVFFYDEDDGLAYIKTIRKPASAGVDDLDLSDFTLKGDLLYVLSNNMRKVIGFNVITGNVEFSAGAFSYEAGSDIPHKGNGLNSPKNLVVKDDGRMYVSDYSNYNIIEIFKDDYIHPDYPIPENIDILYSSVTRNEDTGLFDVPVGEEPPTLHLTYRLK